MSKSAAWRAGKSWFREVNMGRLADDRLMGAEIVTSPEATQAVEDWSGCRSPGRARRRHARGIPQRMRVIRKPAAFMLNGKLVIHPELKAALSERLRAQCDRLARDAFFGRF